MHWIYYLLLLLLLLSGLVLNVMTLPGNWLMLIATALYAWVTHESYVGRKVLLVLLVLASVAEVIELLSAGRAAKSAGGSRWGSFGALFGALLGGILLTGITPILGTLVGVLAGTFLGAMGGELISGKEVKSSLWIGAGATKGRLYGTILKIVFGLFIGLISLGAALPLKW